LKNQSISAQRTAKAKPKKKKIVNLGKEERRRKGYYSAGEDIADPER
jgi:hypothetical protein